MLNFGVKNNIVSLLFWTFRLFLLKNVFAAEHETGFCTFFALTTLSNNDDFQTPSIASAKTVLRLLPFLWYLRGPKSLQEVWERVLTSNTALSSSGWLCFTLTFNCPLDASDKVLPTYLWDRGSRATSIWTVQVLLDTANFSKWTFKKRVSLNSCSTHF